MLNNPRKTENDVVIAMGKNGVCSRITTLNEIHELKERQILEDIRAKPNNFSCLVARDENEYTRIYNELAKIKIVINGMDDPIQKLSLKRVELSANEPNTEQAIRDLNNYRYSLFKSNQTIGKVMVRCFWYYAIEQTN